ncbi:MAG: hypothetical protein ACPL3P_10050 [Anaerolineales bacterium]
MFGVGVVIGIFVRDKSLAQVVVMFVRDKSLAQGMEARQGLHELRQGFIPAENDS